jgi:hypothetical protein
MKKRVFHGIPRNLLIFINMNSSHDIKLGIMAWFGGNNAHKYMVSVTRQRIGNAGYEFN